MQADTPQHIILSRSDNIGDVVLTLPMARAIKNAWPRCQISVLARQYVREVVTAHPDVDHFIDWDKLNHLSASQAASQLKHTGADTIIHVFPKYRIANLARRAKIKRRIGTNRRWYNWFSCNHLVNFSRKKSTLHEAQLNMLLLRALKLPTDYHLSDLIPMIQLNPSPLSAKIAQLIDPDRFTLILHPLSHGHGRQWSLTHFTNLSRSLNPKHYQILVTGSSSEGDYLAHCPLLQNEHVTSLCGQLDLGELLSLLAAADGVIASSTGPLHMAAACGTKTAGLFPKKPGVDPLRWGPVGQHAQTITCREPCTGCTSDHDCHCMRLLQVKQVSQAIQQWQQQKNKDSKTIEKGQSPLHLSSQK